MIDRLSIEKKLNDLVKNAGLLNELSEMPLKELEASIKNQWSVFYGLQISIQIIVDIGNHILASIKENQIEDYADIIDKLGQKNIIPEKFAEKIRGMVGLRNLLVHEYGIIDIHKIYDILKNNTRDFAEFKYYIEKYIGK